MDLALVVAAALHVLFLQRVQAKVQAVQKALKEFRAVSFFVQVEVVAFQVLVLEELEAQCVRLQNRDFINVHRVDVLLHALQVSAVSQ